MNDVNRARQHAASAALAAKRGEIGPGSLRDGAREMFDSMTEAQLAAIAGARHADLPDHEGED